LIRFNTIFDHFVVAYFLGSPCIYHLCDLDILSICRYSSELVLPSVKLSTFGVRYFGCSSLAVLEYSVPEIISQRCITNSAFWRNRKTFVSLAFRLSLMIVLRRRITPAALC